MPLTKLIVGKHFIPTKKYVGHRRIDKIVRDIDIILPNNIPYTVKTNTLTDWGSIPKFADDWLGIDVRRGSVSYLTHDILYRYDLGVSRLRADIYMWQCLRKDGASIIERNVVFLSVRLFGWIRFNKDVTH